MRQDYHDGLFLIEHEFRQLRKDYHDGLFVAVEIHVQLWKFACYILQG